MMHTNLTLRQRWENGDEDVLNLAAWCPQTTALGPGLRAVIWLQGCRLRCPGCVSPGYQPVKAASLVTVEDLAALIANQQAIDGVTFSGGEPMLQAAGLARLVALVKAERPQLSFIAYTGFRLADLQQGPLSFNTARFIHHLDVLIDGPYIQALDNGSHGLKGSANQTVHHLSPRLQGFDFEHLPRQPEIYIRNGQIMFVGIPANGFTACLDQAIGQVQQMGSRLVQDVRA
jgi:anaerobic ribonucleoside-triphosphate reductase activating protein